MTNEHQCCRLTGLIDQPAIDRILATKQRYFPSGEVSSERYTFDLENKKDGYPCVHLNKQGCSIHSTKPQTCTLFPTKAKSVSRCTGCSYTFDSNNKRTGTCNGCNQLTN